MIGVTLHFNLTVVLLAVAVVLFAASVSKRAKGWFVPIGLACFAGAFLADRLVS